jgi:phage shock protein A
VKANEWESRALLALDENNDEALAREALAKKDECEAQALALQKRWETQKAATEALKVSLQRAKERVSEARRQHTLLIAQYKSAQTKQRIHESLSAPSGESPMMLMDRLAERIRRIEAETDANLELNGEVVDHDLEDRFVAIEQRRRGDQALEALRARLAPQGRLLIAAREPQLGRIDELKAKLER